MIKCGETIIIQDVSDLKEALEKFNDEDQLGCGLTSGITITPYKDEGDNVYIEIE